MSDDFLSVDVEGMVHVVTVRGEIDLLSAPELRQALDRIPGDITVDLSEVRFMGSSAIHVLVAAHKRAESTERRFMLRSLQPNQQKVIDICGLTEMFVLDDGRPTDVAPTGAATIG